MNLYIHTYNAELCFCVFCVRKLKKYIHIYQLPVINIKFKISMVINVRIIKNHHHHVKATKPLCFW